MFSLIDKFKNKTNFKIIKFFQGALGTSGPPGQTGPQGYPGIPGR